MAVDTSLTAPNAEPLQAKQRRSRRKQGHPPTHGVKMLRRVLRSVPIDLLDKWSAIGVAARKRRQELDGYRARHAVLVGSVRSHAIVFVTPEVRRAHALVRAAVSASRSVAPSTARHALLPPNSMHTSQRTPPTWRLV